MMPDLSLEEEKNNSYPGEGRDYTILSFYSIPPPIGCSFFFPSGRKEKGEREVWDVCYDNNNNNNDDYNYIVVYSSRSGESNHM